jgi:toxin ParE1/3/4
MTVRYRERALADIDELFIYLNERSPQGARNVLREIHRSVAVIAEQPSACVQTEDPKIRVKIVRRYRYKIFYHMPDDDTVEILHIRHMARRPWTGADSE